MKAVVIGGRGMLGRKLMEVCQGGGWEVVGYDIPELDITKMDGREVEEGDWVINCAAYTQVDKAEEEATKAFEVNAVGAGKVAKMCREMGMRMVQVSTDYVFNGKKREEEMMQFRYDGMEYDEGDKPDPLNVYGMSKWMGEVLVQRELPGAMVVRTQSLFGDFGQNFVKSILKQVEGGKKELRVVQDQISSPTYVEHLAEGIVNLMDSEVEGVVHVSADGYCSWNVFAKAILREAGIDGVEVIGVKTDEFPVKAQRPLWSVLCKAKYMTLVRKDMPGWEDGLREYMRWYLTHG